MATATKISDQLAGFHPELVAAVRYFSRRSAEIAVASFRNLADVEGPDFAQVDISAVPFGLLLELGALGQLQFWQTSGLSTLLPEDTPSYDDAADDLCIRIAHDPQQFQRLESASLSKRVLQLWIDHFDWKAPLLLGADLVVGEIDEDLLIEIVSQLLWEQCRSVTGGVPLVTS